MPPAKQNTRSARAPSNRPVTVSPIMIRSDAQPAQVAPENALADNTPARPAMPSGTVRARRVYPRYRKGKVRAEPQLEPAAPNPPVFKKPEAPTSIVRQVDPKARPQTKPVHTSNDEVPSMTAGQPTIISQSPDKKAPQTSHTAQHANPSTSLLVPPQQDISLPTKHIQQRVEHSHPQEMHQLHHQLPQHSRMPATAQYRPMVQQHVFPMHLQADQHFNPHMMHIPSSVQVTHSVPTQALMHMSAQQQEVPFTQPRSIQVLAPPSSHASAPPPQSVQPAPKQNNGAPDLAQAAHASQVHAKRVPPTPPMSAEKSQQTSSPQKDCHSVSCHASTGGPSPAKSDHCGPSQIKEAESLEQDKIAQLVSRIKSSFDSTRARPRICQDITNSNADTLRISRLPRGVTYDRLLSMVEPFGEVEDLAWTASDPYVCDVTYRDAAAAHEAKHFLGDALVGDDSEPPLKAELRSRDPGAQLFVGDLTPDVTEDMLEAVFSELVGEPVTALLKRDPDSFSPIGYGFLSFKSESSANFALVAGHRIKVGNACVRVGRAERNTYLYVSDLAATVTMEELKNLFGKFGTLVDEDTVIVRRSYAFVRYKNRNSAEKAKRTLDKTDLKGRLSVRYAEAEPLKACVAVQFHSSVPRPPNSLRDLLTATFSKHGNCSVEIPRLSNGMWRKVAFVTFHGEPIAANMAALEAVQSVRFVSSLPVCCQFARELIPRLPSRGMSFQKAAGSATQKENRMEPSDRFMSRNFLARRNVARRNMASSTGASKEAVGTQQVLDHRTQQPSSDGAQQSGPNFVPVYVPLSALQHPNQQMQPSGVPSSDCDFSRYHWQGRMLMPNGHPLPQNMNSSSHTPYNSFTLQERSMRW